MGKVLTDEDVGGEGGGQAEDDHQDVRERQVDDEVVGDGPHARRAHHHGHDEAVADEADGEHDEVGDAVERRHARRVSVHEFGPLGRLVGRIVAGVAWLQLLQGERRRDDVRSGGGGHPLCRSVAAPAKVVREQLCSAGRGCWLSGCSAEAQQERTLHSPVSRGVRAGVGGACRAGHQHPE